MEPKRTRLRQLLGMVEEQGKEEMKLLTAPLKQDELLAADQYRHIAGQMRMILQPVEWSVFREVKGEGILTDNGTRDLAPFIVIPDCGFSPEQAFGITPGIPEPQRWANRIAGLGHRVLAVSLLDRRSEAAMPGPVSTTLTRIVLSLFFTCRRTLPPSVNWQAFASKLRSTCRIRRLSPVMRGKLTST